MTPYTTLCRHHGIETEKEALSVYRLGDGAASVAKTLGLAITSRGECRMAGFPYHQLDAYLGKLIAAGHRVALCEQVDGPAPKGAKVERRILGGD